MRILVVTPWFPTVDAPTSGLFVAREVESLAAEHDVHVLHLDWNGPAMVREPSPSPARVERVRLRRPVIGDYRRARRLVDAAAQGADVVHTHSLTVLLPWMSGRVTRRPWVHSEHWSGLTSPDTLGIGERVALRALRPALDRPDVVVVESSRLRAAVAARRAGPIAVVPCVVPESPVTNAPRGERLQLIGIGGLIPRKGPLLAVGAVAELVARGVDAGLTWVGEGNLRADVERDVAALGLGDRVILTGTLSGTAVTDALDRSDMLLLPTRGDNFCVVAAEALSRGRPIVSGSETGAVDYADAAVSRFVGEQSASAYADAVVDLRSATAHMTSAAVAATVKGRFTHEKVLADLDEVYRRAVAS